MHELRSSLRAHGVVVYHARFATFVTYAGGPRFDPGCVHFFQPAVQSRGVSICACALDLP
jgi:hypothetical protein